jgi:hypothetical protein
MLNLPALVELASEDDTAQPGSAEHQVRERVCGSCHKSLDAGDYCAEFLARTCPLSRSAEKLMTALEKLIAAKSHMVTR